MTQQHDATAPRNASVCVRTLSSPANFEAVGKSTVHPMGRAVVPVTHVSLGEAFCAHKKNPHFSLSAKNSFDHRRQSQNYENCLTEIPHDFPYDVGRRLHRVLHESRVVRIDSQLVLQQDRAVSSDLRVFHVLKWSLLFVSEHCSAKVIPQ